jgi:DNA-binding response OmpR family regulator
MEKKNVLKAFKAGASNYLIKHFSKEILLEKIKLILEYKET